MNAFVTKGKNAQWGRRGVFGSAGSPQITATVEADASGELLTLTAPDGFVFVAGAVIVVVPKKPGTYGVQQEVEATITSAGVVEEDTPGDFIAAVAAAGWTEGDTVIGVRILGVEITDEIVPDPVSAPTVAQFLQNSQVSSNTSHPVTLPEHSVGQRIVVGVVSDGGPTVTAPEGWEVFGPFGSGSALTGHIVTKVAASASETLTLTHSVSEQSSRHIYVLSGQGTGIQVDGAFGTGDEPDPPSVAHSFASGEHLSIAFGGINATNTISAAPVDYTNFSFDASASSIRDGIGSARKVITGSPENPGVFTASNSVAWVAMTCIIEGA
jgi:hypothetical protein